MPVVSADTLQLAHARETSPGVLPTNPVFNRWRTTGESLAFAPQTSESGELGGSGRFQKPSNVTGMSISGDINFELSNFLALREAIAGIVAANWGECPLTGAAGGVVDSASRITVGNILQTFTIEKKFPNVSFVRGTVPTVAAGATGSATGTLTFTGAAGTGTGMVVVELASTGGSTRRVTAPIAVGDDAAAVAAAVAAEINKLASFGATAAAGVVTITPTAGTVDTLSARAGQDAFFYQRYKGATYNTMNLAISPNNPITGSVGVVGGVPDLDYLPLPGATYVAAGNSPVFTAPKVLRLDIGQSMGIGTSCWTAVNLALNSQNRGIACIGTQGDKEVVLGTLTAELTGDVYFSNQDILQALLDNRVIGDSDIVLENERSEIFRFDLYGLKPVGGQLSAGGKGQDLTIPLTMQPTPRAVCVDAGEEWESGLVISTVATAPTLPAPLSAPAPITIAAAPGAANVFTVTVGGGPATAVQTATFTYQIDGSGTDKTFQVAIGQGDSVADVIAAIQAAAAAAGVAGELVGQNATATTVDITKGTATALDALSVAVV